MGRRGIVVAAAILASPSMAWWARLAISEIRLHQYDGGPPVAAGYEYYAGDTVFVTFNVQGFGTTVKEERELLHLTYQIEARDPAGVLLKEPGTGEVAGELTRQDKETKWMPLVRYEVPVPPPALSGEYRLVVRVRDEFSRASAESTAKFLVKGADVEPSETLVVRDFGFYRSETSVVPLRMASYRPGDSLWARFQITGYRFAENNRFWIDYGIRVLRANGETLFEQPVAVEERRESFYPERHIAGALSLNLTPDLTAGEYTIILTARDHIGGQEHEVRGTFLVE